MNEIQIKLLAMMQYFHGFCLKNNLKYYILGGTALGAIRHNGFIPWDDDIDIGMPRADYERMKRIANGRQFDKYCFEYPGEKDFVYPYCKMYDMTTTLVESTRYKTKRGIYIDIFPLDGIGNTKDEAVTTFKKIDRLVNLFETKVCALRKGRALYKNCAIIFMRLIPEFIVSRKKLFNKIEEISRRNDFDKSKYVANCVGNWHEKEIIEGYIFGTPKKYCFENITVFGPEYMDEFLTGIYGDWRTLPPKEKQVSHHDYISMNLNKSFK